MKSILLIVSFIGLFSNENLFGQSKFDGTFENKEIGLKIAVKKQSTDYLVQFSLQGNTYKGSAQEALGFLNGTYLYNNQAVAFSFSKILGQFFFTSEGIDVPLQKIADTAQNLQSNTNAPAQTPNNPTSPTTASTSDATIAKANGQKVTDENLGFNFNIPTGFTHTLNQGNHIITRGQEQFAIAITASPSNDKAQLFNELNQNTNINGVSGILYEKAQYFGTNGVTAAHYFQTQGQTAYIYSICLTSPYQLGAYIVLTSVNAQPTENLKNTAKSIAKSLNFFKPIESPLAQQWKQRILGKRLLYLYTGNGLSDKWYYDLCSDGTYVFKTNSSYTSGSFSDNFSYAAQDGEHGVWKIIHKGNAPFLLFISNNGNSKEFQLSNRTANNEIDLNGKRYFITTNETCK